jgi:hypothetical protein
MTAEMMPVSAMRQSEPLFLYHVNVFIFFLPYASIIFFSVLVKNIEFMIAVTVTLPPESTTLSNATESTTTTTLAAHEPTFACPALKIPVTDTAEDIATD